ncbi:hypothetical protein GCM10023184_01540 [Flaviaesturariibacter amylovorans]|uniref:Uncharacterized protein n=2 Tax=Flaviaesturariibacter amylovorans TaxID=1084520 RepID=A0ABP8G5I9_9BACT
MDTVEAGSCSIGTDDTPTTRVRFNPVTGSLRLQAPGLQRLFFLEAAAPVFPKIILHNEYGLRMGTCTFDDSRQRSGTLQLDEGKYRFTVGAEGLLLRRRDGAEWRALPDGLLPASADFLAALLFAFCWQCTQPAAQPLKVA